MSTCGDERPRGVPPGAPAAARAAALAAAAFAAALAAALAQQHLKQHLQQPAGRSAAAPSPAGRSAGGCLSAGPQGLWCASRKCESAAEWQPVGAEAQGRVLCDTLQGQSSGRVGRRAAAAATGLAGVYVRLCGQHDSPPPGPSAYLKKHPGARQVHPADLTATHRRRPGRSRRRFWALWRSAAIAHCRGLLLLLLLLLSIRPHQRSLAPFRVGHLLQAG